jgi:gliding motility-associated-like protein
MKVLLSILVLSVFSINASSQNLMSNSTVNSCTGNFQSSGGFASGGAGASGYGFNENFTMTFCPGTSGSLVSLDFVACVIGAGDILTVYNGTSTAAPLLGVYDATTPAAGIISAQLATNPGGCLTFTFVSDGVGSGNGWNANITCDLPCQAFEIGMDSLLTNFSPGGFVDVCNGDTAVMAVTGDFFNNNLNYNQTDGNTQFYWYNDTTLLDSGRLFNYLPTTSGAVLIQAFAVDTLGCSANFNYNFWIRIGSDPIFAGSSVQADTVCFGDTNTVNFNVASVSWSNSDTMVSSPTTFLPDGSGSSPGVYVNTLTFTKFGTGDVVTSVADINKFWASMEHTFLGDLSIKMTCPNGSNVILKNFPGGGGTNLGEPCAGTGGGMGNGFLYEWYPTGNSNLNMVAHVNAGCTGCVGVTSPCTGGAMGNSLPAASYNSFGSMTNMIGCPLNGTWSLTIVDQWAADDGYLFSWGVELDSSLYPSTVITFDPGIDSTWIDTALFATTVYASSDSVVSLALIDSASYCYTFNVLDGFGCYYDTTICYFVRDMCDPICYTPQSPSWVTNKVTCAGNSDGSLIASPNVSQIPFPWTFIWTNDTGLVLQTTVGAVIPDSIGGLIDGVYHLQIIDGNGCESNWTKYLGTTTSMQVIIGGIGPTSCYGVGCDGSAQVIIFNGNAPYSYLWGNGDTLSSTSTLCAGMNTITVTDGGGCVDSSFFTVTEPTPIVASATGSTLICVGNSTPITGGATGGTAPYSYSWLGGLGAIPTVNVSPMVNQTYSVVVTDANNCTPDTAMVTVFVRPALSITFDDPDTLCVGDTVNLLAHGNGGDSLYNYTWEQGLGNTAGVQTIVSTSQYYSVTVTDGCGSIQAVDSVWLQIGGFAPLQVTTTPSDTICLGDQFYMHAQAFGGDGKFSYSWNQGLGGGQTHIVVPTQSTAYTVTVVDQCLTPAGIETIFIEVGNFEDFNIWVDTNQNCDPGIFKFGFDTVNANFDYQINFGSGLEFVNPNEEIIRTFTEDGCHDINVKLTTNLGCVSNKVFPCLFTVLPSPVANFDFNSHSPDILEHYVDFWDKSIGAVNWTWYTSDTVISTYEKFSYPFPVDGVYNIKLVVSNSYGCLDSINTDLPVAFVTTYFYPTAFTPDGNGFNEVFKIVGDGVMAEDYNLMIYNRWGDLVFNTSSRDQGWDGTMMNSGKPLMAGVYSYTYTLRLHDGRKLTDFGQVTLLK